MYLGVDYYPEHWNEDMLEEDLNNKEIDGKYTLSSIFYLKGHYVTFKPVENFCIIVI